MKLSPTIPWKRYLSKEVMISGSMVGKIPSIGISWLLLDTQKRDAPRWSWARLQDQDQDEAVRYL